MKTDILKGLTDEQVTLSRKKNGLNLLTPPAQTPWWKLYFEKFKDPIIIILLVATAISLIFGVIHDNYIESIGIIIAILLATGVGFWQEYSAKRKFDELKSDKDFEPVKVRRNGTVLEVTKDQLVVDDIVLLNAGDEIPADIILLSSTDMKVSESAMTGESVAVSKHPLTHEHQGSGFAANLLLRGTTIEHGLGEGVVVKVGDQTEIGKTTHLATEKTDLKTPLEEQLIRLANKISKVAFGISLLMFIILNITHWIGYTGDFGWETILLTEIKFLMAAVVIIIVAVPEGLPLSVTLALAFSMKTMAKENNLVKKMNACETIGAIDIIFTDKTGTLTQNSMTVVDTDVAEHNLEHLKVIGALNSSSNWSNDNTVIGNPTEGAILKSIGKEETSEIRDAFTKIYSIPFSSANKYMVTAVEEKSSKSKSILIKGAPEVIAKVIGQNDYLALVAQQQERGRRAITAAILDVECDNVDQLKEILSKTEPIKSTYIGTWFIEDPIRSDVPSAIEKCYKAGIDVVMMTGDNLKTGSEIGRQSGLKDIWAIEAKDFKVAVQHPKNNRTLPNIIARCTPNDKLEILKWTQAKGHICAMTGDGVNDSPSLNHADVGIAMGTGTSVAKEAADIILLDDAFPSIVTGVKWGRSLYKNIQNFLFLQLSINVSACLIAVFGPIVGVEMPFTVTQFLWINLVMDALAAVALASEPADENVLNEKPRDKNQFIITKPLAKAIFGFGGLVWLVCTFSLWGMNNGLPFFKNFNLTIFFAGYMMINWWNLFNARVIGKGKSSFTGLGKNPKFTSVSAAILILTILIVQYGGEIFQTQPLNFKTWIYIIAFTAPVAILRELWYWLIGRNKQRKQ